MLAEYGIVVGQRLETLRKALPGLLVEGSNPLVAASNSSECRTWRLGWA
nr:hypothetical protein [Methylomonas koyamae]